jgi:hypothetical protein
MTPPGPIIAACTVISIIAAFPCYAKPPPKIPPRQVAKMIGVDPLVRNALKSKLDSQQADALLALPPRELGWKVIQTDHLATIVVTDPSVKQVGRTDGYLTSINGVRAMTSRPLHASVDVLSINETNTVKPVKPVTVTRSTTIDPDGVKFDPAYKILLPSGEKWPIKIQVDQIKWAHIATVTGITCAILPSCRNDVLTSTDDKSASSNQKKK